jgi:hypothetical protein
VMAQHLARVVTVYMITYERESPLKRTHDAVIVSFVMRAFAPVHECFPQNSIASNKQQDTEARDRKTDHPQSKRGVVLVSVLKMYCKSPMQSGAVARPLGEGLEGTLAEPSLTVGLPPPEKEGVSLSTHPS